MSERLKAICPLEIVKSLGSEAIWLVQQAKNLRTIEIVNLDFSYEEEWENYGG